MLHTPFISTLLRYAARLRFKQLFILTGLLFVIDVFIPDFIPYADEILLGLLTLLFGTWRRRNSEPPGRVIPD